MLTHNANLQSFDRLRQSGDVIGHRVIDRRRVSPVVAGHDAEQQCGIFGRSRDDPRLIQAGREGNHAEPGDPAIGRFQANCASEGGGLAD